MKTLVIIFTHKKCPRWHSAYHYMLGLILYTLAGDIYTADHHAPHFLTETPLSLQQPSFPSSPCDNTFCSEYTLEPSSLLEPVFWTGPSLALFPELAAQNRIAIQRDNCNTEEFCSKSPSLQSNSETCAKYLCLEATITPPCSPKKSLDQQKESSHCSSSASPSPQTSPQWAFDYNAMSPGAFVCFNTPINPKDDNWEEPKNPNDSTALTPYENQQILAPDASIHFPDFSPAKEITTFTIIKQTSHFFISHLPFRYIPASFKRRPVMMVSYNAGAVAKVAIFQLPMNSHKNLSARQATRWNLSLQARLKYNLNAWAESLSQLGLQNFLLDSTKQLYQKTITWSSTLTPAPGRVVGFLKNAPLSIPFNTEVSWIGTINTPTEHIAVILTPEDQDLLGQELDRLELGVTVMPEHSALIYLYKTKNDKSRKVQIIRNGRLMPPLGYTDDVQALMSSDLDLLLHKTLNLWCIFHKNTLMVAFINKQIRLPGESKNASLTDVFHKEVRQNYSEKRNVTNILFFRNFLLQEVGRLLHAKKGEKLFSSSLYLDHKDITSSPCSCAGIAFTHLDNLHFVPNNMLSGSWIGPAEQPLKPFWALQINHLTTPLFTEYVEAAKSEKGDQLITIFDICQDAQ